MSWIALPGSVNQSQWALRIGQAACWLPGIPTISSTGQIILQGDVNFVLTFHDWLRAWLGGRAPPMTGELVAHDYKFKELVRYAFTMASISSLGFPMLDTGVLAPGRLAVTLQAASVTPLPGPGKGAQPTYKTLKAWRCCDFALHLDDVDTHKVSHVDQADVTSSGTFPTLNVLVSQSSVKGLLQLYDSGEAVAARIHYLSADHFTSLFTLGFAATVASVASVVGGGARQASPMGNVPVALTVTKASLSTG